MTTTQCFEFQEPANMKAIRSNIIQRIKKRTPIDVSKTKHTFLAVDSGLPSPPIESCSYEEYSMPSPTCTLPDSPSSSSTCSTRLESAEAIREKIKLLKQEKHVLFQTMKNLLSQPKKPIIRSRSNSEFNRPRYHYKPYRPLSRRNSSYVSSRSQLIRPWRPSNRR